MKPFQKLGIFFLGGLSLLFQGCDQRKRELLGTIDKLVSFDNRQPLLLDNLDVDGFDGPRLKRKLVEYVTKVDLDAIEWPMVPLFAVKCDIRSKYVQLMEKSPPMRQWAEDGGWHIQAYEISPTMEYSLEQRSFAYKKQAVVLFARSKDGNYQVFSIGANRNLIASTAEIGKSYVSYVMCWSCRFLDGMAPYSPRAFMLGNEDELFAVMTSSPEKYLYLEKKRIGELEASGTCWHVVLRTAEAILFVPDVFMPHEQSWRRMEGEKNGGALLTP